MGKLPHQNSKGHPAGHLVTLAGEPVGGSGVDPAPWKPQSDFTIATPPFKNPGSVPEDDTRYV